MGTDAVAGPNQGQLGVIPRSGSSRLTAWALQLCGWTLLAAAALKAYSIVGRTGDHQPAGRLVLLVILAEAVLGVLSVSGRLQRVTVLANVCCFSVFAGYSAIQVARGAGSCGCFGDVQVSPLASLGLDIALLCFLAYSCLWDQRLTSEGPATPFRRMCLRLSAAAGAISIVILAAGLSVSASGLARMAAGAKVVVLEPESWLSTRFDVADLDINSQLQTGHWFVLFHRAGCAECRRTIERMDQLLRSFQGRHEGDDIQFAYVNVSAAQGVDRLPADFPGRRPILHGELPSDREWFIETPVLIEVRDSVVCGVHPGPDAGESGIDAIREGVQRAAAKVAGP